MDDNAPRDRKSRIQASNVATNVLTIAFFVFALFPVFWILLLSLKPDEQLFTTYFIFDPTLETTRRSSGSRGDLWHPLHPFLRQQPDHLLWGGGDSTRGRRARRLRRGPVEVQGSESLLFTLLSFRFAPELTVIIPLYVIYQQLGLFDTYVGMIWVLPADRPAVRSLDSALLLRGSLARARAIRTARRVHPLSSVLPRA